MSNDAAVHNPVRLAEPLRPLRNGACLATEGHHPAAARIARLHLPRCPDAVLGSVVPVTLETLDRMYRARPRTHIGPKVREAVAPAVAHGDAATAVMAPSSIPWIAAAVSHQRPDVVFRVRRQSMAMAACGLHEGLQASATRRVAPAKIGRAQHRDPATIASALPEHAAVTTTSIGRAHYNQSPITLPGDLERCWHRGLDYHAVSQSSTTEQGAGA